MKIPKTSLIIFLFLTTIISAYGQTIEEPKYNLELVSMTLTDTIDKNDVLAIFAVTPIKKKDFPPVLSMRIGYDINGQNLDKFIDIQNQKERKVNLVIYGKSLPEKNPQIYNLIKNEIDFDDYDQIQLLAFQFKDISKTEIEKLSITYGLWEKRNTNKRIEQTFVMEF